jgi:diaminopimelate decarboxylase
MSASAGCISTPASIMASTRRSTSASIIVFALRATANLRVRHPCGADCDSEGNLYRRQSYEPPVDLAVGDTIDFLSAGAYAASVAAVAFNPTSAVLSKAVTEIGGTAGGATGHARLWC